MKRLPGKIKDKYKILGVIGEGTDDCSSILKHSIVRFLGAYGIVLKARRRVSLNCQEIEKNFALTIEDSDTLVAIKHFKQTPGLSC